MNDILKITLFTVIFCVCDVKFVLADNSSIGDECKLKDNNSGTCVLLKDCSSILNEIKIGVFPKICSFQQTEPIICCPEILYVKTKPSTERISRQKCREYGQSVFSLVDIPILINNSNTSKVNMSMCNINKGLIISGPISGIGEFPHMALIGNEKNGNLKWSCSGTLISDQYILTTIGGCSHVLFGAPPNIVRLGVTHVESQENEQYIRDLNISEITMHPDFKFPFVYNNIALIKLENPVEFNKYIRPACLPDLNQKPTNKLILTAWYSSSIEKIDKLTKYLVEKVANEECHTKFDKNRRMPHGVDNNTQLCTKTDRDRCFLLYGSPLQTYDDEIYCMYNIQGLLSYGNFCLLDSFDVYMNVSSYLDWIEKTVWS